MPSIAERLGSIVIVALLAACGPVAPSGSEAPSFEHSSPLRELSPIESPTSTRAAGRVAVPAGGRPWNGTSLLEEMRRSPRPGGVPSVIQTPAIAEALATEVWTVDGAAWNTTVIEGFCGTSTCTVDIAGSHIQGAGEDLWTLEVDLGDGSVRPVVAEVRSLPWELVDTLDRLARELDADGHLGPMQLTTTRWLPPPADPGRFLLSYRSGGEKGSCARELLVDAFDGEIVEETAAGC